MEMNINKMFQDKNKEILKNSLILEMERNLEALKKAKENGLLKEAINKISKYYEEN